MILWTIQPEEVFRQIQETGVYHCDIRLCPIPEFREQYDWMADQMRKRIGAPPKGVSYPVWAWYQWNCVRKKPDLRRERWAYSPKGNKYVCIEVDVPDEQVLLSDLDSWCLILNNALITTSEEEDKRMETIYKQLSNEEQKNMMAENWENVFDLTPIDNGWIRRGSSIQATFWELRKEQIRRVQFFTASRSVPES